jgi:hypothetical protein
VYTVMKIRLHKMRGNSWLDEKLLACQEGLRTVKLGKPMSNLNKQLFQKSRISMSEYRVSNCRVKDSRSPRWSGVQPAAVLRCCGVTRFQVIIAVFWGM